jgi:hypothetical protein
METYKIYSDKLQHQYTITIEKGDNLCEYFIYPATKSKYSKPLLKLLDDGDGVELLNKGNYLQYYEVEVLMVLLGFIRMYDKGMFSTEQSFASKKYTAVSPSGEVAFHF